MRISGATDQYYFCYIKIYVIRGSLNLFQLVQPSQSFVLNKFTLASERHLSYIRYLSLLYTVV